MDAFQGRPKGASDDMMMQFTDALDKAAQLHRSGVISPDEYESMLDKINSIIANPKAQRPTVQVPMPRPDPRGSTFTTRLPRGTRDSGMVGTEYPPEVLLGAKGIDTTRKNGDALDFNTNPKAYWDNNSKPFEVGS